MNWILNAWRWLIDALRGVGPVSNVYDLPPYVDRSVLWDVRIVDRREYLTREIARLRKNKKKFSHLQAELDNLK